MKRMVHARIFSAKLAMMLLASFAPFCLPVSSSAQVCAGGYDRPDRVTIKAQNDLAQSILTQMASRAELAINGVFSVSQVLALENEFQALKGAVVTFGDSQRAGISVRSNLFLAEVIDPNYLGIGSSVLVRPFQTIEQMRATSMETLNSVNLAKIQLANCLWGSWERRQIQGVPNDGQCAGGYTSRDRDVVQHSVRDAIRIVDKMGILANQSATGVYSASQRALLDFDFEYLREDLDILGSQRHVRASVRTKNFLNTLIDPIYLGLQDETLNGPTILDGQIHSREALASLADARTILRSCSGFHSNHGRFLN